MNSLAEKIQDSELEVMHVLWRAGKPVPLIEIRQELSAKCGWEDSTIKTLLRRLCEKGIAKVERRGVYSAVVSENDYNNWSTRHYVRKVFEGSAKKLVASLFANGQLSEADIADLSAMFNRENPHE